MTSFDAEELFWKNISTVEDARSKIIWGAHTLEDFNKSTDKEVEFIKNILELTRDDVVLDYGCGIGRLMKALSPYVKHVVGLDVSNAMIVHSKKYLENNKNVTAMYCSTLAESPVALRSVNNIYSFIVLQHINKYKVLHILKNLKNYLAPGGLGLFQLPDLLKDKGAYKEYADMYVHNQDNNCSLHFWTKDEAKYIFELAGWKVVDIIDDEKWSTDMWVLAE